MSELVQDIGRERLSEFGPNNPACSVIIPLYNARKFIRDCLSSVFEQETNFPFEVIVVDDGSEDEGASLVGKEFPDVRLFRKQNGGPGSARNHGGKHAQSEILVFLDSDDKMLPGRIQHQVDYMFKHPDVALTFGNQRFQKTPDLDSNFARGICTAEESYAIVENAYARLLVEGGFVQSPATAVRKEIYLEVGGQPEDIFVAEDYAMYCAIAVKYPMAASNRFLTWYRQDDHGNLMGSRHTYFGPPSVLQKHLDLHGNQLGRGEYAKALERLRSLVNMQAGYCWTTEGRKGIMRVCQTYINHLSFGFRCKWLILSFVPTAVPRYIRKLKHGGQESHR